MPDDSPDLAAAEATLEELRLQLDAARLTPLQIDQIEQLDSMLRQHHPPYAHALERRRLWNSVGPRAACNFFVLGWSNVVDEDGATVLFRRVNGEVPDALLDRLPPGHMHLLGLQILTAMFPTVEDAKKPASPSGSAAAPTSSTRFRS